MRPVIIFVIISIIIASSLVIGNRAPFAQLEAMLADVRTSWLARTDRVDPHIVIVAITEESLENDQARSPIDRAFLGRLITAVDSASPAAVGLDIVLDRPTQPVRDQALRTALSAMQAPLVLISTASPAPFEQQMLVGHRVASPALNADGNDSVVRLLSTHDKSGRAVLAASMASPLGAPKKTPVSPIRYGLTASGELPFQIIPAHHLLATPALQTLLNGRHVLIGGIFDDSDQHETPLRFVEGTPGRIPGVVVHAFQLRQLLGPERAPPAWPWTVLGVILATGIGLALGRSALSTMIQSIIFLVSLVSLCLFSLALFASSQIMINLVATGLALMMSLLAGFAFEGQHRRAQIQSVRKVFGTFLAPDYVKMLERDPDLVTAAAQRADVAVLFTDLAGFTALIERLAPEAIEPFLNAYLDQITQIIVAAGGTIDKIVGDSVHALFGVPIVQGDAAQRALACAKQIVLITKQSRAAQPDIALGMTRVGVHFGPALVGNFGGSLRLDYTAHGSTINIAAQLEAANTALGTQVCISEAIYLAAGKPAGWRSGGSVWLRGLSEPMAFLTLTHDPDNDVATEVALKEIDVDPSQSLARFQALDAADPIVRLHLARLSQGLRSTLIDLR